MLDAAGAAAKLLASYLRRSTATERLLHLFEIELSRRCIVIDIEPRLLTKRQAADYLSTSRRTVERLVAAGLLLPVRLGQRQVRFHREELDLFIESLPRTRKALRVLRVLRGA